MTTGADAKDILDLDISQTPESVRDSIMSEKKKPVKKTDPNLKKPEGMHRELWGLLWTDNKDAPPIIPTDTNLGYKQMKAKIGRSRVRPWKWMPFTNPARKDGAVFYHWRRLADEGKDYPFARFNKSVDIPTFSDMEYQQHLHSDSWSRQETDHLFELCKRFDLRFTIVHDRWDRDRYQHRSIEDMKERYYSICNILTKVRAPSGSEPKIKMFDADHERRRKEQLIKLFERTQDEVEEEQFLLAELKKIELRKREREKKTQDLQKLITAADSSVEARRGGLQRSLVKKKVAPVHRLHGGSTTPDTTGIKFPDFKQAGVTLRSHRMKLPAAVGQKKTKAIEQVLEELGIDLNPIPTDDVVQQFNELRQDIVLLYELKLALANCEYELQTLRHRFETLAPGKVLDFDIKPKTPGGTSISVLDESGDDRPRKISETIDVVGTPGTPNRKRRAALEQSNMLKKMKQRLP